MYYVHTLHVQIVHVHVHVMYVHAHVYTSTYCNTRKHAFILHNDIINVFMYIHVHTYICTCMMYVHVHVLHTRTSDSASDEPRLINSASISFFSFSS